MIQELIGTAINAIGGKRVYIINLVAPRGTVPALSHDGKIVEIPGLLDETGRLIPGILDHIKQEDYEV